MPSSDSLLDLLNKSAVIMLLLALMCVCLSGEQAGMPPSKESHAELTPESLGMPRTSIVLSDRMLRLFNGRGAVHVRDKTVTGLQTLTFPPIDIRDYRFQLAFREETSHILIQDVVADVYEQFIQTGKGPHPLGLNFQTPGGPFVMLVQEAHWQPNLYSRTGTFHKQFDGRWISFGIESKLCLSAESDEAYLEVKLENRQPGPLVFTVIPEQRAPSLVLSVPGEKAAEAGAVSHPDAYALASNQIRITVISDLAQHGKDGWNWEIPGNAKHTARFAIVPQPLKALPPDLFAPDLAQRIDRAESSFRTRLQWAAETLPQVSTASKPLTDLYHRCILNLLGVRWERENFVLKPFYTVGNWPLSVAWDTSYASGALAILDPESLREHLLMYIRAGLLRQSYIPWNGTAIEFCYLQTPFAAMRILQDYLKQTGDQTILDYTVNEAKVLEWMKRAIRELMERFARPDGLLDFGPSSNSMLELRTDGYQHVVAATNGMAAEYLRQLAGWCRNHQDPDAPLFEQQAVRLGKILNEKLWNDQAGWFENLYPDGSRHLVWSYHLFDLLGTSFLTDTRMQRMVSHLREGEFLAPYGMYSISKADRVHWDLEDVDWGGGGQYAGGPLRIAESLFRLGFHQSGWDILNRCAVWSEKFPYIPQEIFGDYLASPEVVEMEIEIAPGAGIQTILFGVFGLRPQVDGSLEIAPSYQERLGEAKLTGYRYRGHKYDVVMRSSGFEVFRDGKSSLRSTYDQPAHFPPP
jgi:hypothetical protein